MVESRNAEVASRDTVISELRQAINELRSSFPIHRVYLYGSYAHGKPGPYSDVDVAVFSPAFGKDIIEEGVALMRIFDKTGLMVEPRAYPSSALEEATSESFVRKEIVEKGLQLV